jgi:hypothetical protein
MWFEWYEESLLDAQIWKSAEQAEERMRRLKFSPPTELPEPVAEAIEQSVAEQPRGALAA